MERVIRVHNGTGIDIVFAAVMNATALTMVVAPASQVEGSDTNDLMETGSGPVGTVDDEELENLEFYRLEPDDWNESDIDEDVLTDWRGGRGIAAYVQLIKMPEGFRVRAVDCTFPGDPVPYLSIIEGDDDQATDAGAASA